MIIDLEDFWLSHQRLLLDFLETYCNKNDQFHWYCHSTLLWVFSYRFHGLQVAVKNLKWSFDTSIIAYFYTSNYYLSFEARFLIDHKYPGIAACSPEWRPKSRLFALENSSCRKIPWDSNEINHIICQDSWDVTYFTLMV